MKPTSAKNIRYEKRKKDIIDKALKIIDKDGLEKLTVRNLAIKLKKSPTALYKYFKNKDKLLDSLRREQFSNVLPMIKEKISGEASGKEKLFSLAVGYIEYARKHPHLYQLSFHSKAKSITMEKVMRMQGFKELLDIIGYCVEKGEITLPRKYSIETYTFHSWITLHGIAMLSISVQRNPKSEFHDFSKELLKTFFQINQNITKSNVDSDAC